MPTAAQWKVAVNAKRRKHCGQAGEAWAGGAWKQRWMAQAPTKGEQPSMGSRDGRAFTPGPGRYTAGNPGNCSVRYDCLKHSRVTSVFDEQKVRWTADTSGTVAQFGGVVVNPCRGFSLGSGFGPGQTLVAVSERMGMLTAGPTYQNLSPDLNFGCPSVSTRGPCASHRTSCARGGGLSGVSLKGWEHTMAERLKALGSNDTPHAYGSLEQDCISRLSTKACVPAFSIGGALRKDVHSTRDTGPGPATYDTQTDGATVGGRFSKDPCLEKFEDLKAYPERLRKLGRELATGPGSYEVDARALDHISSHDRSTRCSALLRPHSSPGLRCALDQDPCICPGPQSYDVQDTTRFGPSSARGVCFGSEQRITGGVTREAQGIPGPDAYRPLLLVDGDCAHIGDSTTHAGDAAAAGRKPGTFGCSSPRIPPDATMRKSLDQMYNVPAPDEDWTRSHGPRWSFAKASPRIAAPPTMPAADRARSHGLGRGDGGASSQRRQAKELAAVRDGQEDVGEGCGADDAALKTGGPGRVNSCEGGRRRRGNRLLSAAALADGQGEVGETAAMTSVAEGSLTNPEVS